VSGAAKSCGGCTLCCDLVPVDARELKKRAFTPCPHLRSVLTAAGPGCGIYGTRPRPCQVWSCVWLTSPDLPAALRPDRCGVVIDPVVDLIKVNGVEQAAAQIWAAPSHEMAFEDEAVQGAITGILAQVPFVLWRQRGADGEQWARVIAVDPASGKLGVSPLTPSTAQLGSELERWARVDELAKKRNAR
jgi:hypothetical protein